MLRLKKEVRLLRRDAVWFGNNSIRFSEKCVASETAVNLWLFEHRKAPYTLSVKLSDFTVWCHNWRKNWVNWSVLIGSSAGFGTIFSIRILHTELRSSLRESRSFLSLPADTTMASSQGTSLSSNSFSRWTSHDIFLFKYHFLLHILRFLFFFSDNIMADVASKTANDSLVFIHHCHTHKKTHRTDKKLTNLMGNLCCAREHSVQFFVQFLLHS